MVSYDNTTDAEKIPNSPKTEDVAMVQGSLYFEFNIGENWNYNTAFSEPSKPKDTDLVTFTLKVNDDTNIDKVMIEIVQIKPIFSQELPLEMDNPSENTYTYERDTAFDAEAQIGYRFHILYNNEENPETVPIDSGTAKTEEEQGELYFVFTVDKSAGTNGNGDTEPDDEDDDEGIPIFFFVGIIIVVVVLVIVVIITRGRKKQ
jgi:hypothetical protein